NIAVHDHMHVNLVIVQQIIEKDLDDFLLFKRLIIKENPSQMYRTKWIIQLYNDTDKISGQLTYCNCIIHHTATETPALKRFTNKNTRLYKKLTTRATVAFFI